MATATTCSTTLVVLKISEEEAHALSKVLRNVGGHPDRTRRGLTNSIMRALEIVGINDNCSDMSGGIYFEVTR